MISDTIGYTIAYGLFTALAVGSIVNEHYIFGNIILLAVLNQSLHKIGQWPENDADMFTRATAFTLIAFAGLYKLVIYTEHVLYPTM